MELLDQYFDIQQQIYEYFGYKEDWVVIPIDDRREYIWKIIGDSVWFANSVEELISQKGNCYQDEIYTQRFLPKWVYRGKDYTMICVDTHTDGNKFLAIYSNKLEHK